MGKKSKGKKKAADARTPTSDVVQEPRKPSISLSADAPEWHPSSAITTALPTDSTIQLPRQQSAAKEITVLCQSADGENIAAEQSPASTPSPESPPAENSRVQTASADGGRQQTVEDDPISGPAYASQDPSSVPLANGAGVEHAQEDEVVVAGGVEPVATNNTGDEEVATSSPPKPDAAELSLEMAAASGYGGVVGGEETSTVAQVAEDEDEGDRVSAALEPEVGETAGGAPAGAPSVEESGDTTVEMSVQGEPDAVVTSRGYEAAAVDKASATEVLENLRAADVDDSSFGSTCAGAAVLEAPSSPSAPQAAEYQMAHDSVEALPTERNAGFKISHMHNDEAAKRTPTETSEVLFKSSADGFARTAAAAASTVETATSGLNNVIAPSRSRAADAEEGEEGKTKGVVGEKDVGEGGRGGGVKEVLEEEDCGGSTDEMTSNPTEDGSEPDSSKGEDTEDGRLAALLRGNGWMRWGVAVAAAAAATVVVVGVVRRR